jgi:hypothetical protein
MTIMGDLAGLARSRQSRFVLGDAAETLEVIIRRRLVRRILDAVYLIDMSFI